MTQHRVIYYDNCWFTNVGEAFIDIGSHCIIKKLFGEDTITAVASNMSSFYLNNIQMRRRTIPEKIAGKIFPALRTYFNQKRNEKVTKQICNLQLLYDAEYFILSGMFATKNVPFYPAGKNLLKLAERGTKIIFLGLGGAKYSTEEIDTFRKYLDKLKPDLIVTRDYPTYLNYKDSAECISGIDCAFWVVDSFDPRGMAKSDYDVVSFNRTKEPAEYSKWPRPVIRPKHFQYSCVLTPPPP